MRTTFFTQVNYPLWVCSRCREWPEHVWNVSDLDEAKLKDALQGYPIPTIHDHLSPQDYQGFTKWLFIEMFIV